MAATTFFANKIIDKMLRNQTYTPPSTIYRALFTSATDDAGGGTEVSGGSYARQAVTLAAAASKATSNSADLTFPVATANWGTLTHGAYFDASTGGNMLIHGALAAARTVNSGDQYKELAGDLDIAIS
jgi:hypothetical protein